MLMTENEAGEKFCHRPLPSKCLCAASSCAAWRWNDPEEWTTKGAERRGYCGLAGNPNPVIVMTKEGE